MIDPTAEPQGENARYDSEIRINQAEERLTSLENTPWLRAFEERLSAVEEVSRADDGTGDCCEGEGLRALRLALAELLNKENVVTAVSGLVVTLGHAIKDFSSLKTREFRNQRAIAVGTYFGGLAFSAFVLIMLSALLWHDKITRELAAGLFGSLIGYWYGRDKRHN